MKKTYRKSANVEKKAPDKNTGSPIQRAAGKQAQRIMTRQEASQTPNPIAKAMENAAKSDAVKGGYIFDAQATEENERLGVPARKTNRITPFDAKKRKALTF